MEVINIVENYLKENGYGGLVNTDGECGCEIGDLAPCEHLDTNCQPAYKIKADCKACGKSCGGYNESENATCFVTKNPNETPRAIHNDSNIS